MRILLVDDEEELVSALAERLNIRGIAADFATSGEQALQAVERKHYDLVVLDVKMPHLNGLDLWKQLKQQFPNMKCIFLTGHTSERDFQAGVNSGAMYLLKPLKIETLIHNIHVMLPGRD